MATAAWHQAHQHQQQDEAHWPYSSDDSHQQHEERAEVVVAVGEVAPEEHAELKDPTVAAAPEPKAVATMKEPAHCGQVEPLPVLHAVLEPGTLFACLQTGAMLGQEDFPKYDGLQQPELP